MRLSIFILITMLFAGCTTTKPSMTEYMVVVSNLDIKTNAKNCKNKSLKIKQAFSSNIFMSLNMSYVEDINKVFEYSSSQWREVPNHAITLQIYKKIRQSKLFKTVLTSKSRSRADLVLEINLEDFLQYYTKDLKELNSNVVVSLALIDMKTNKVVSTQTLRSKVNSHKLSAEGGVEALNLALTDVLRDSMVWLDGVCK